VDGVDEDLDGVVGVRGGVVGEVAEAGLEGEEEWVVGFVREAIRKRAVADRRLGGVGRPVPSAESWDRLSARRAGRTPASSEG